MTLNQMPQEISALNVADVAPFTEILTGTVTFNTSARTWTLPKSENILAGYLICTNYWNVTEDIPQSAQQIFFTTQKSFGYFGNSVSSIGSLVGVEKGDAWNIFSNSVSDTSISVNNGVVDVIGKPMPFLGTYWYCLIYGVKSK